MKILCLTQNRNSAGGIETFLNTLEPHWKDGMIYAEGGTYFKRFPKFPPFIKNKINYLQYIPEILYNRKRVKALVDTYGIDLVFAQGEVYGAMSKGCGVPVVTVLHGSLIKNLPFTPSLFPPITEAVSDWMQRESADASSVTIASNKAQVEWYPFGSPRIIGLPIEKETLLKEKRKSLCVSTAKRGLMKQLDKVETFSENAFGDRCKIVFARDMPHKDIIHLLKHSEQYVSLSEDAGANYCLLEAVMCGVEGLASKTFDCGHENLSRKHLIKEHNPKKIAREYEKVFKEVLDGKNTPD